MAFLAIYISKYPHCFTMLTCNPIASSSVALVFSVSALLSTRDSHFSCVWHERGGEQFLPPTLPVLTVGVVVPPKSACVRTGQRPHVVSRTPSHAHRLQGNAVSRSNTRGRAVPSPRGYEWLSSTGCALPRHVTAFEWHGLPYASLAPVRGSVTAGLCFDRTECR